MFVALVPAACGSGANGDQNVPSAAAFARQQLAQAGWTVNMVLTRQSTGICGGRMRRVLLDVSANQVHLSGGVALKHPHLSAWLFPRWQQAVACLKAYVRGSGAVPKAGNGVEQVFKTLGQTHVAEQVHGYFVLTSSTGSPAALKRASERAFAGLGVGIA
ncbi:MAG TPA: hypothetical protein VGL44_13055 [Gaiellales bacterium]